MKSETIFELTAYWMGRWGEEEGYRKIISSCFDDPTVWPFTLKTYEMKTDEDTYDEIETETGSVNIPIDVFNSIKECIRCNTALRSCSESIENPVMDGGYECYFFSCDSYTKRITGDAIYLVGQYEMEGPESKRTDNYTVACAFNAIRDILGKAGIELRI